MLKVGINLLRRTSGAAVMLLVMTVVFSSFLAVLPCRGIALAAVPAAALEISPSAVKLAAGQGADVLAVVRNATQRVMRKVRLSGFSNAGVAVSIATPELDSLAVDGSHAWNIHVVKSASGPASGGMYLRLDYEWKTKNSEAPTPGVATATVDIQENLPDSIDKVAEARMEASLETLEENRPETAFLVVRNIAAVPILVESITAPSPPLDLFLLICNPGRGVSLAPQESRSFPILIKAENAVHTGEHLLLLELGIHWEKWGQPFSGTLLASQKLSVGVLGESDILKLLGVPTFLFLPGFLMAAAFMALWKFVSPKKAPALEAKSTEFWLIAITLSLLAAPAYSFITRWFGSPRNYLVAYGMRDVFWVWIGSIGVAAFVWLVITGSMGLMARWKASKHAQRTFSEDDSPVEVLRKLALNGLGFSLTAVDVTVGSTKQQYLLLEQRREGQTEAWISPPIVWEWRGTRTVEFASQFMKQLDQVKNADALADLIERGCGKGNDVKMLDVSWKYTGEHPVKKKLDGANVTVREDIGEIRMVEEKV
jgi:hypothetical protein